MTYVLPVLERIARALESLARSQEKLANPLQRAGIGRGVMNSGPDWHARAAHAEDVLTDLRATYDELKGEYDSLRVSRDCWKQRATEMDQRVIDAAIAKERDACASLVENFYGAMGADAGNAALAEAIRARSGAKS